MFTFRNWEHKRYEEDSDGSSSTSIEDTKRKREGEDIETEKVKKSKKQTERQLKKEKEIQTMEEVMVTMKQIMTEIKAIRDENKEYREEIKELRKENEQLRMEMKLIHEKTEKLDSIEWKMEKIERKQRKNNIAITGLQIHNRKDEDIKGYVEQFIKNELKVEACIKTAYAANNGIVIAEVENFDKKMEIMENKGKLHNIRNQRVYINNDYTKKESEIQRVIRNKAKEEVANGNKVKIGYQKITINGITWRWDEKMKNLKQKQLESQNIAKN